MRICVPITALSSELALDDINAAKQQGAGLIELRLDLLQDLSPENLEKLIKSTELPLIVTFRSKSEGGHWEGDCSSYLQQAIDLNVAFVDLEWSSLPKLALKKTKAIYSYHNFDHTPPFDELKALSEQMFAAGADIAKIACMSRSTADNEIIYQLIKSSPKDKIIAIGMGGKGKETRIRGPKLGAYLTFASLADDKKSAPGQLLVSELRKKHLALIGGRGVGKSITATTLAKLLDKPLYSLDQLITKHYGAEISQIVKERGWTYFRDLEYQILLQVCALSPGVVDCGGGIICEQGPDGKQTFSQRKCDLLKSYSEVFWLTAEQDIQLARIKDDDKRPALTSMTAEAELKSTMDLRSPWYLGVCDHKIQTENATPAKLAKRILEMSEHII